MKKGSNNKNTVSENIQVILFLIMVIIIIYFIWLLVNKKYEFPDNVYGKLRSISWTIFKGPSIKLYDEYWKFFDSTDEYLKVQTYDLTNQFFKTWLQNLSNRSIPIQIIIENNKFQQYQDSYWELVDYFSWNKSIHIGNDEQMWTTYVHSKFMLNEDSFWIQTANLTKSSIESSREYFFHWEDEELHNSLELLFDADWGGNSISTLELHPNLVVCPLNCREIIEWLLKNAKHSIVIQTQYILDDEIINILREKVKEIELSIILSDRDENYELAWEFGPEIVKIYKKNYNHTKTMLIDGKYLLIWSMNLSSNSLDKNREVWIILIDNPQIKQFKEQFDKDREKSI